MNKFNDIRDIPDSIEMVGDDDGILYEKPYIKRDITGLEVIDRMQRITKAWKYRHKLNMKK